MDNPLSIWQHAFEKHLSRSAKDVLIALVSLPHEVFLTDLGQAFESYHVAFAEKYAGSVGPQDFKSALRELEGDFLSYSKDDEEIIVQYRNPSVRDFVLGYLKSSTPELEILFRSIVFLEQLRWIWDWSQEKQNSDIMPKLITADAEAFRDKLRRLQNAAPCNLITCRYGGGKESKIRYPYTSEQKADFVLTLTEKLEQLGGTVLREALQQVEAGIGQSAGSRWGLYSLVNRMIETKCLKKSERKQFIAAAKQYLFSGTECPEDLSPLGRLIDEQPDLFDEKELARAKQLVEETATQTEVMARKFDPERLRDEADILKTLGQQFDVNVQEIVTALESRAEEKEGDRTEEKQEPEYASSSSGEDDGSTDEEIISLFSLLGSSGAPPTESQRPQV
jgi:hypothetical protein